MIIERQYATFNELVLCMDEGGELFAEIMERFTADMEPYHKAAAYAWIGSQRLCDRTMEWGMSESDIEKLINGFAKLDKKYPYYKEE